MLYYLSPYHILRWLGVPITHTLGWPWLLARSLRRKRR